MRLLVIGNPIKHSKSPDIHNTWLKRYNLNYKYFKKKVESKELPLIIEQIRIGSIKGINVTLPYKKEIIRTLDLCDEVAHACDAVNTVFLENKKIIGTNTDGIGFMNSLTTDANYKLKKNSEVFILGAGGAAKGIIYSLLKTKLRKITVSNRNKEKAAHLINELQSKNTELNLQDWENKEISKNTDLVINTTSFGMNKHEKIILDYKNCKNKLLVFDIIYSPSKTLLLKDAEINGFSIQNGLGMLIRQAAHSFYKWFGIKIKEREIFEMKERLKISK